MAKKIYPITKFRFIAVGVSVLLLIIGLIAFLAFGGFNLGIDFQSGFSQRVQIAPPALSLSYSGSDTVTLNITGGTLTLVYRDASGSRYSEFSSASYPTVGDLANAISSTVPGVTALALDPSLATAGLITGFGLPTSLSTTPFVLNSVNPNTTNFVSIDEMRDALGDSTQVQIVGDEYKQVFQIRLANDENLAEDEISESVGNALRKAFGSDAIVVLQSDFVGPKYSSTLVSGSILIVIVSITLILLYIWFRFKLAYALAAIITLVHDAFLLVGFIALAQLEVSSTTIAALLTIIGYSLNNVIVIFDRIRENRPILKDLSMMQLIDTSVSQSLSRTLFSSLTTALAILPLAILASGAIQLFAIEMVFGIVVGAYSSNFLAPALLLWITKNKNKGKPVIAPKPEIAVVEEVADKETAEKVEVPMVERKLKGKRQQKK
ncbi:MAG: protein translocase subunit SecF [Sphaerochaetaceae bacterium]|jgi:preprotein translocase subunit SecF|nr:protein translocase subunit SecF [Sphaerochaetaceae bacterium]